MAARPSAFHGSSPARARPIQPRGANTLPESLRTSEMLLALAAPLGLVIGSFLNVVAYRLPPGGPIVNPPPRCTTCGTEVGALDNIPLVSCVVLRGRCRHCSAQ